MGRLLVFGYGNPSRGDDVLGPLLVEALRRENLPQHAIEFQCDYQLQVEHALDLVDKAAVLFVDAHARCAEPFWLERIAPRRDASYTTHAMTPQAVLEVYRSALRREPPPSFLLSIRGERFGLGEPMSGVARASLQTALEAAASWCRQWLGEIGLGSDVVIRRREADDEAIAEGGRPSRTD
jgi:hydrogenase maturation protease